MRVQKILLILLNVLLGGGMLSPSILLAEGGGGGGAQLKLDGHLSIPQQIEAFRLLSPQQQKSLIQGRKAGAADLSRNAILTERQAVSPIPMRVADIPSAIEVSMVNRLRTLTRNIRSLHQFGYGLFSGSPTTFLPVTDIPIPSEYILGPGDELRLKFYGTKNDNMRLVVDREGVIELPKVGPLNVAGISFVKVKALIAERVRQKMIGTTISVSMGRLRSIRVFVLGDVNYPGSYIVSGLSTISHALYAAGGISKKGSLRHVQLKRRGKISGRLDLYQFLLKGNSSGDKRLQPGDVVFVPPVGKVVGVAGQVTRPGIYELKNEKNINEITAIAGGALPDADVEHLQIDRFSRVGDRILLDFNLKNDGGSTRVWNGDIVLFHAFAGLERGLVSVQGEVKRPGQYGMKPLMRVLDLITAAGGGTEKAFMNSVDITRYDIEGGEYRKVSHFNVNISEALAGNQDANVFLQAHDIVIVRSLANWRAAESVTLEGEFIHPGHYPIEEGERLSSVIRRVGGVSKDAYFAAAVFTRQSVRIAEKKRLDKLRRQMQKSLAHRKVDVSSIRDIALQQKEKQKLTWATRIIEDMNALQATGRMVIELKDLKIIEGSDFDLRMKDGDRLYIPKQPEEVMVIGQVMNTSAFLYRSKYSRDDYIKLAGGVSQYADSKGIYIVHANGTVEVGKRGWAYKKQRIQRGDAIIVPEEIDYFNPLDSMLDWSKVMMQIGIGTATMRTLGIL